MQVRKTSYVQLEYEATLKFMYTTTTCIQVSRVPQETLCRGNRWVGGYRMDTLSHKISHFHGIQDIKNLLGQLLWKHRTVLWQCLSAALNENQHTFSTAFEANPLCHTASREQISDALQGAQHVRGKHIHWQMASSAANCIHGLCSRCDKSKQHIHESLSISHLKDTICSLSGTVTAESTKLLAGLKSKLVLLKYSLASSCKFTFFYLQNC